jgi:catechol 2,3-dioxygenase-like lactoylglutathione lyase family enzyme
MIKIALASVYVDDQDKALRFYTDVLGFVKKRDIPLGEARWLTVTSPYGPEGVELLLEPNTRPIARAHQQGLFSAGIPATVFTTDDIKAEYERLTTLGVVFTPATVKTGPVTQAIFDDTCGNLILLAQESLRPPAPGCLRGLPGRWSRRRCSAACLDHHVLPDLGRQRVVFRPQPDKFGFKVV